MVMAINAAGRLNPSNAPAIELGLLSSKNIPLPPTMVNQNVIINGPIIEVVIIDAERDKFCKINGINVIFFVAYIETILQYLQIIYYKNALNQLNRSAFLAGNYAVKTSVFSF